MKKYISIIALLSLFVIGCSEQTSINSPVNNVSTNEPNWIALPQAEGMQVNQEASTSKLIDGPKGGEITLKNSSNGGLFGTVTIDSKLQFPKGAFHGKVTFTVTHDDEACVSTFGPSFVFNKDLTLNVKYSGVDLTGIDLTNVKFAYLAVDGSLQYAVNDEIVVDLSNGTLSVKNAKIRHFSRYGFIR